MDRLVAPGITGKQAFEVFEEQYGTGNYVDARFAPYRYAENRESQNISRKIVEDLKLNGDETIVDFGGLRGELLSGIRVILKHEGLLVCLDKSRVPLIEDTDSRDYEVVQRSKRLNVRYLLNDFMTVALAKKSVDVGISAMAAYHAEDVLGFLMQMRESIKDGGQGVFSTSGLGNKYYQRLTEQSAARKLGVEPPPIFAERFTGTIAKLLLPQAGFRIEYFKPVVDTMAFGPSDMTVWYHSAFTMGVSCNPSVPQDEWVPAVVESAPEFIEPVVQASSDGKFREKLEQYYIRARAA